jgi:hypothetical protein
MQMILKGRNANQTQKAADVVFTSAKAAGGRG